MPCGWEGNRRSDVRFERFEWLRKGNEHPAYTLALLIIGRTPSTILRRPIRCLRRRRFAVSTSRTAVCDDVVQSTCSKCERRLTAFQKDQSSTRSAADAVL